MIEGQCHCGRVRWRFDRLPDEATICNCTICRRYAAIWAYDWDGARIHVAGKTASYIRSDAQADGGIGFHFCPACGCVAYWRAVTPSEDGRHRVAVNLRMAPPAEIAAISVRRFDGLESFGALPPDGRCLAAFII